MLNSPFEFNVGDLLTFTQPNNECVILERYAGGFSAVYIVQMQENKEIYALKTPRVDLFGEKAFKAFVYEAQLWMTLPKHYCVVMAYQILNFNEKPFLKLQYVPSINGVVPTLSNAIQVFEISIDSIEIFFTQLLHTLMMLDSIEPGFIHGDLKTNNVYVTKDSQKIDSYHIMLADFGLSSVMRHGDNPTYGGSLGYISPEKLEGIENGQTSDIYSLGCILFEMLTKQSYQYFDQETKELVLNVETLNSLKPYLTNKYAYLWEVLHISLATENLRPKTYKSFWTFFKNLLETNRDVKVVESESRPIQEVIKERNLPIKLKHESMVWSYLINEKKMLVTEADEIVDLISEAVQMRALSKFNENVLLLNKVLEKVDDFPIAWAGIAVGELMRGNVLNAILSYKITIDGFLSDAKIANADQATFAGACCSMGQAVAALKFNYPDEFVRLSDNLLANQNILLMDYTLMITEMGLKMLPIDSRAYLSYGMMLAAKGDFDNAIRQLEHALSIDPNNQKIKKNLSLTKELIKRAK